MPRTTKATTKPRTTKVPFSLQLPGAAPEKLSVKSGYSVNDFCTDRNIELKSYIITANGSEVKSDYQFQKNDVIRIGLKTKNN